MKRNQRIKLILDLINKKRRAFPKKETFYFQYEEFTNLPLLKDRVMLDQLFNRIQKESDCIVFILPKIPEYLIGKSIIEEKSERDAALEALRNLYKKERDLIELDSETINSFSTITVHIEDFDEFDNYYKQIKEGTKHPVIQIKTRPGFDENSGKIKLGDKECRIPLHTNQYFLCKKMFSVPFGERIKEIDIMDSIDWDKDTKRSVYDAMRAVNAKIKGGLGIENFLCWRNNHIWINDKLFGS